MQRWTCVQVRYISPAKCHCAYTRYHVTCTPTLCVKSKHIFWFLAAKWLFTRTHLLDLWRIKGVSLESWDRLRHNRAQNRFHFALDFALNPAQNGPNFGGLQELGVDFHSSFVPIDWSKLSHPYLGTCVVVRLSHNSIQTHTLCAGCPTSS